MKNAARVAAAAGLGLTLAFTAAPVVAMAEGTEVVAAEDQPTLSQDGKTLSISSDEQLKYAVEHATDESYGSVVTWQLAAGAYNWPKRSDGLSPYYLNLRANVSLADDPNGSTTIVGHVWYGADGSSETITVSHIRFTPGEDKDLALQWSNSASLSSSTIVVENCTFDGWTYGVQLCNGSGNSLSVKDSIFTNTFCGVSANTSYSNSLTVSNLDTPDGLYAVQDFNTSGTNNHYKTDEDFSNKTGAVDDVDVPTSWEAVATIGDAQFIGTLEDAVAELNKASDATNATITLNGDVTLEQMLVIKKPVTINGNGHTISGANDFQVHPSVPPS